MIYSKSRVVYDRKKTATKKIKALVQIEVLYGRKEKYISTGVYVTTDHFDRELCEGERIDVRMVAQDILRRARRLNVVRIGYDAYKSQDLVNTLMSVGNPDVLQSFPQTYGAFNKPVENFEMVVYDSPRRIVMNNNPINVYCLSNCVIDMDALENKKLVKASQYRKIDGAITMLMTIGELYEHMA